MSALTVNEQGQLLLGNLEEQGKYASYLIANKLVSDTFKTPAQLIVAMQALKDLNLPTSCLKDFYVIGGKPAIYGDTFVALALGSGMIQDHTVEFFDEQGNKISIPKKGIYPFSCLVTILRKGSTKTVEAFYSMDDKEISNNNNPTWKKHPTDMLFRRAMTRAIKFACPDAVRGIEVSDYLEENPKVIDSEKAKAITEIFSDQTEDRN